MNFLIRTLLLLLAPTIAFIGTACSPEQKTPVAPTESPMPDLTENVSEPVIPAATEPFKAEAPYIESASEELLTTQDGAITAMESASEAKIKEMSRNVTDLIAEASGKTPKGELFILNEAVQLGSLEEGGFSPEPSFVDDFDYGWETRTSDWQRATWVQNKTKMAKERAVANQDGHLVLTVKAGEPKRGGSIQSKREFGYGRWIARVRPSSVPGVLNSVFTKDWDDLTTAEDPHDGRKAEVDFEFLTYTFGPDSGEIHLAIHLKGHHPLWHIDIPLDFNPSDDFREWGFDILPDKVVWHVDGKILFAWEYTDEYFIDPMYEFFFNAWTKQVWIKGPPREDAAYHIDWLKFYPLLKN